MKHPLPRLALAAWALAWLVAIVAARHDPWLGLAIACGIGAGTGLLWALRQSGPGAP